MSRAMQIGIVSAAGALGPDTRAARAREIPPDITSAAYWQGATACATLWLAFLLYAVIQGFG